MRVAPIIALYIETSDFVLRNTGLLPFYKLKDFRKKSAVYLLALEISYLLSDILIVWESRYPTRMNKTNWAKIKPDWQSTEGRK